MFGIGAPFRLVLVLLPSTTFPYTYQSFSYLKPKEVNGALLEIMSSEAENLTARESIQYVWSHTASL